jgi:hypothetical protein
MNELMLSGNNRLEPGGLSSQEAPRDRGFEAGASFVSVPVRLYSDLTLSYLPSRALLGPSGVVVALLEYCEAYAHTRSTAWAQDVVHSVKLFLEYLLASGSGQNWLRQLTGFAHRLHAGTFDLELGVDPTWLCWTPQRASRAYRILARVQDFLAWLDKQRASPATSRWSTTSLGRFDRLLEEAAYQHRRSRSLLGHTWEQHSSEQASYVAKGRAPPPSSTEPPRFPDSSFEELLFEGFKVRGRLNYRDALITLLMHGAAFRASEPFHIYTCDVFDDPVDAESSTVLIHHPSDGAAPERHGRNTSRNRAEYLSEEFGLLPRHIQLGSRHAGWKGGRYEKGHQSLYFRAYWFPAYFGKWFRELWGYYLTETVHLARTHPFAFVNTVAGARGDIYCLAKFIHNHDAAVRRIGLDVAKEFGTTTHGHRHAYGHRLEKAGVAPLTIMHCMHHCSEESQRVYTQPSHQEIASELRLALQNQDARLPTLC